MDQVKIGSTIATLRKKAGLTQEDFAEKLGVTPQAVSKWEKGRNLPDIENLMMIAEIINIPYSTLLEGETAVEDKLERFNFRDRLFHEDNMFTRMKTVAQMEKLEETFRALHFMREHHLGQFRKQNRYSSVRALYINHPLLMACQAHAFGIHDDALLSAILLHDVVEDTDVSLEELPFSDEVKEIVGLVSFSIPEGMTQKEAKDQYYQKIRGNGKACVVKIIDRCNNVSTMAASFDRKKLDEYVQETEEYIVPLFKELKHNYPQYSELSFLVKYHLLSVLETIKYFLVD